jgi:hypothetical protein
MGSVGLPPVRTDQRLWNAGRCQKKVLGKRSEEDLGKRWEPQRCQPPARRSSPPSAVTARGATPIRAESTPIRAVPVRKRLRKERSNRRRRPQQSRDRKGAGRTRATPPRHGEYRGAQRSLAPREEQPLSQRFSSASRLQTMRLVDRRDACWKPIPQRSLALPALIWRGVRTAGTAMLPILQRGALHSPHFVSPSLPPYLCPRPIPIARADW